MRPRDIEKLVEASGVAVDPDGSRAVLAVARPSLAADGPVGRLWSVPLDGSTDARRPLTAGRHDSAPRFTPDGSMVAFLRAPVGGKPQLHVVDARGGEPVQVTDAPLGVREHAWFPDGRRLAFTAADPEHGRYGTVEGLGSDAEPPRRVTTLKYRANGRGYTIDQRSHVFVVEVPDLYAEPWVEPAPTPEAPADGTPGRFPVPVRLTSADADHTLPVVTPDGSAVVVVASLHESRDLDLRSDVWSFAVPPVVTGAESSSREPERLTDDEPRDVSAVGIGPDGTVWFVAAELGPQGTDFVARTSALYVRAADGVVRRLTDPERLDLAPGGAPAGLVVDGDRALVLARERGRVPLVAVTIDGDVTRVVGGDVEVGAFDVADGVVVWSATEPARAGALGTTRSTGVSSITTCLGTAGALSDVAPLGADEVAPPLEEEHPSADGTPVHGWVTVPRGPGPHPVLLMIHGGPFAQYGVGLFDETQVYAGAGYAVVQCNPRGSSGYGRDHGLAIKGRMGTVDLEDVLAFLDGALADHPELDSSRVGILGGSYGGYLTAWTIAHDHRFAAAVVERGYLDPEAFVGTSDIGTFFSDEYTGTDPAQRAAQSPQAVVGDVRTPTLVVHSEQDLRCPLAQAERYYAALARQGVATELLVFPGETHELTRNGRPRHRVERFDAILEWFGRYLPVGS